MPELESAILRTIAYFDLFNYPLTSWEVWKWLLGAKASFLEVQASLSGSAILKEKLEQRVGFVFLRGRQEIVVTRQERYRLALEKLDRAQRFTRTLARLPFVRAVFVCNSLGFANARAESDIDFFIIVKRNHAWTARLFAAGWAKLRRLRPMPGNRADKLCLSFFLADDSLDLSGLRLPTDPYLTMWLATLVPFYDPDNLYEALWQANAWAQQALPNTKPRVVAQQRLRQKSFVASMWSSIFQASGVEKIAELIQQRVLSSNLRNLANRDTRVILNSHMLKFHDNDRRQEYAQAFAARLTRLGL